MSPGELRRRIVSRLNARRARADVERLSQLTRRGHLGVVRSSVESFIRNDDLLWASALTFTTGLAIVPVLALALSALKGFHEMGAIKPLISTYLAFNSPEVTKRIFHMIGNMNAQALGEVGAAMLLVTVVITLGTVEAAFNNIFNVAHGRRLLRKFSDYLSVTFTVPLLLVAAVPVNVHLLNILPHVPGAALLVSSTMIWVGFWFLYIFFPNTHVNWRCAAIGAVVAAFFLQVGQWAYVRFQAGATNYQAIYGALAAVPILLTWIYIAWVIVLYGAELTASAQGIRPSFGIDYRTPAFVRSAALLAVFRAGERMHKEKRAADTCTPHSLAAELGVPEEAVLPIITRLKDSGMLVESIEEPSYTNVNHGLYLARDSGSISIAEVLACLQTGLVGDDNDRIHAIVQRLAEAEAKMFGSMTVRDLVAGRGISATTERHQPINANTPPASINNSRWNSQAG
ncbi:MAG: YhjD/YihY/BrkB family envelope integrity protein [Candidatus Binataceae bacterium]